VTERVSVTDSEAEAVGGDSTFPTLAPDGNKCGFQSKATNLTGASDTDGFWDIYLRDVIAATTTRISVSTTGQQGNGDSVNASLTVLYDGTILIVYHSYSTNLHSNDTDAEADVYLYIKPPSGSATTHLISRKSNGSSCDGHCTNARISPDGRYITYVSTTTNVIDGLPTDGKARVYLFDRILGVTRLVSVDCDGNATDANSGNPAISNFAQFVAFDCLDTNMVKCGVPLVCASSCDANGPVSDVIVRNLGSKGDLNGDGRINATDQTIQNQNWGSCPCCAADLDHDGDVDNADRATIAANWTD
jgi:hypothetical protein